MHLMLLVFLVYKQYPNVCLPVPFSYSSLRRTFTGVQSGDDWRRVHGRVGTAGAKGGPRQSDRADEHRFIAQGTVEGFCGGGSRAAGKGRMIITLLHKLRG